LNVLIFFSYFSIFKHFFHYEIILYFQKKITKHEACPRKSEVQVGPSPGMNVVSNVGWAEEKEKLFYSWIRPINGSSDSK
jgi:hypothetical protein